MSRTKNNFRGNVINTAEKREQARSSFGYLNLPKGVKSFSVAEGTRKVTLDIIPYVVTDPKHPDNLINPNVAQVGDLWYKRPVKIHRSVGADNESIICPKSIGKSCPICDYQKKRFADGADSKSDEMKELYAKSRSIYAIIPQGVEEYEDEVICVWDMSEFLFENILIEELRDDPDSEIFPSLEEGKSLEVTFKWEEFGKNKYPKARKIEFVDRDPYDESILDEVPNLDTIFKVLSYKEIEAKFFETDLEETGGELKDIEVDEPPVERKSRRKVKEEEPEKEVEKPARKSRRKEPEAEVEKEEPPRRRERSRPAKEEDAPKDATNKCPHGHVYGTDNDVHDACYDCEAFDDCYDENRAMKK